MIANNDKRLGLTEQTSPPTDHVVRRLQQRMDLARGLGFVVRSEVLGDQPSTWCEVAGKKMMFLDITQTATEQLHQIEQLLAQYASDQAS